MPPILPLDFDTDDLAISHDAFGEVALGNPVPLYTPNGGASFPIDGIFFDAYQPIDPLGGGVVRINSTEPTLSVRLALFPSDITPDNHGDEVLIRGTLYAVREVRPDGVGEAVLMLNEA